MSVFPPPTIILKTFAFSNSLKSFLYFVLLRRTPALRWDLFPESHKKSERQQSAETVTRG